MRIVTVSPKIWNVSVIGISTSPLSERSRPNRPSLCWGPGVSSETSFILPIPSVSVNSKNPRHTKNRPPRWDGALDIFQRFAIIELPRAPRQAVWPLVSRGNLVKLRNRHLPEWRFLPFMRIVTVSPKIWNVSVIGISTSPLSERSRPNRPSLCWGPGVSSETGFILPISSVSVNSKISGTQKIALPSGRAIVFNLPALHTAAAALRAW